MSLMAPTPPAWLARAVRQVRADEPLWDFLRVFVITFLLTLVILF